MMISIISGILLTITHVWASGYYTLDYTRNSTHIINRFRDISLEHIFTPPFVKQFLDPTFYSCEKATKEIIVDRVQKHYTCLAQESIRNYLINRCLEETYQAHAILKQCQSLEKTKTINISHAEFMPIVENYIQLIINIIDIAMPPANNSSVDPILYWITSEEEKRLARDIEKTTTMYTLLLYCQATLNEAHIYAKNIYEYILSHHAPEILALKNNEFTMWKNKYTLHKPFIKKQSNIMQTPPLLMRMASYGSSFCVGLCSVFAYMVYHGYLIRHAKDTHAIDE